MDSKQSSAIREWLLEYLGRHKVASIEDIYAEGEKHGFDKYKIRRVKKENADRFQTVSDPTLTHWFWVLLPEV